MYAFWNNPNPQKISLVDWLSYDFKDQVGKNYQAKTSAKMTIIFFVLLPLLEWKNMRFFTCPCSTKGDSSHLKGNILQMLKINGYEFQYTTIEKLCCAIVWSAKRLMQYILYYTTWLFLKLDLLKYICEKPYISSQIARWQA